MSGLIDKIAVLGREFTIQTELIPGENGKIRTLVYDGGRLVTSREIPSGTGGGVDESLRNQHSRIIKTLMSRASELEATKTDKTPKPAEKPAPAAAPAPAPTKRTSRPLVKKGSHLETAIAIRQTIGPFGIAFAHPAPATAEGYEQCIESVDAALDAIREAPTYHAIRLDEQLTMIALKSQIETWRMAGRDIGMAVEIWPTVERFAHHLQKINHRSDLVTFDHQMLTWAMSELGQGEVTVDMMEGLGHLGGRDAELDQILRSGAHPQSMELLEVLLRLMDQTLA